MRPDPVAAGQTCVQAATEGNPGHLTRNTPACSCPSAVAFVKAKAGIGAAGGEIPATIPLGVAA